MATLNANLETALTAIRTWSGQAAKAIIDGSSPPAALQLEAPTQKELIELLRRDEIATEVAALFDGTDKSLPQLLLQDRQHAMLSQIQKALLYRRRGFVRTMADAAWRMKFHSSDVGTVNLAIKRTLTNLLQGE